MKHIAKKYAAAAKLLDATKLYSLEEASELLLVLGGRQIEVEKAEPISEAA